MVEVQGDGGRHVFREHVEINGRFMAICDMVLCTAELTFFPLYVYTDMFKAFLHSAARL